MATDNSTSSSPFHPSVVRVVELLGEVPSVGSAQERVGAHSPALAPAPVLAQGQGAQSVSDTGSTSSPPPPPPPPPMTEEMQHEPTVEEIFGTPSPSVTEGVTATPRLNTPIPLFPNRQPTLIDPSILLDLRKKFKRAQSQLHRVTSHKEFLQACVQNDTIPQGLAIKKSCNAIFPEGTDVRQEFRDILRRAERDLLQSVLTHYTTLETQRTNELTSLETQMSNFHTQLSQADLTEHTTMLAKTRTNLDRTNAKRSTRKLNKLNRLREPNRRQGGRRQPPRQQQDRYRPAYRPQDPRRPPVDCGGYGPHYFPPPPTPNYHAPPSWHRYGDQGYHGQGYHHRPPNDPHLYHPPPPLPLLPPNPDSEGRHTDTTIIVAPILK